MMDKLRIGFAPTRRAAFSKEEAYRYKVLIREFLNKYSDAIIVIDIEDMNEEGLLYDDTAMAYKIAEKFKREK